MATPKTFAFRILITARETASATLKALTGRVAALGATLVAWFGVRAAVGWFSGAVQGAAELQRQL
ncbi:MAG: hypothetical protein JZU52_18985 [Lamprocystis purpurea]|nr:hypothetical protein [Lamprocystis purpurea]